MSRRFALGIFAAPLLLFGASLLVQALGGQCPGDFLDNPDRDCNFGGDLSLGLFVAAIVLAVTALATAAIATGWWLIRRLR
jgi:hypothetical protein